MKGGGNLKVCRPGKNSVGKRVSIRIIALFLSCILPIFAVGLYLNMKSSAQVQENTRLNMQTKIDYYNKTLKQVIYNILYQSVSLTDDEGLLRYASLRESGMLSAYEKVTLENQIQSRTDQLHNTNPLISRAYTYFPRSDVVFYSGQSEEAPPPTSADLMRWISAFEDRYLKPPILFQNNQIYLVMWSKDYSKQGPRILSCVRLSSDLLLQDIGEISDYEGSSFYLYSGGNFFLSTDPEVTSLSDYEALERDDYVFSASLTPFEIEIACHIPSESLTGQFASYRLLLGVILAVTVLAIAIFTVYIYRLIYKPFDILNAAFRAIENDDFSLQSHHAEKDVFNEYYDILDDILKRLKTTIDEILDYKFTVKEAKMKQLQSNMHPHFLYNSLFNISCLCRNGEDSDRTAEMIEKLSQLFRFITKDENEYTTLETELKYARYYTDIQQMRFLNRISVEFEEPPAAFRDCCVPRLILQPFLENAYKYGFADCLEGGLLRVRFEQTDEVDGPADHYLAIIVENSGSLTVQEAAAIRESFRSRRETDGAMANVNARLKIFYGYQRDIDIERSPLGGLLIRLFVY